MNNDRMPPYSEEAERAVLGSLLLDCARVYGYCLERGITPEHFYVPAHETIYTFICEFCSKIGADRAEILTIGEYLKRFGKLDEVGGTTFLERLIDSTVTSAHAEYYIELIERKYLQRSGIDNARSTIDKLYDDAEAPEAILSDSISASVDLLHVNESKRTPESFHEQHKLMREKAKSGQEFGLSSCWIPVQKIIGSYIAPLSYVIAARTSTGKTAYLCNEVLPKLEDSIPVAIQENDMSEYMLRLRMAGILAGVNVFRFRTPGWTDSDAAKIDEAFEKLNKMPLYINDKRLNIDESLAWLTTQKMKHGIAWYWIDFLQKVRISDEEARQPTERVVGEHSARICDIGKRFNIPTCILSQFSRTGTNKEKDVTPEHPSLDSLKYSSSIEQNADVVILLCKKPGLPESMFTYEHPVWDIDFDIAKHRDGPTGMVPMSLYTPHQVFMSRVAGDDLRQELEARKQNK